MRAIGHMAIVIYLWADMASADDFYLKDQTLCTADWGVLELEDSVILDKRGIGNHYFSCEWRDVLDFDQPQGRSILAGRANCANATKQWRKDIQILVQSDGTLLVSGVEKEDADGVYYFCPHRD